MRRILEFFRKLFEPPPLLRVTPELVALIHQGPEGGIVLPLERDGLIGFHGKYPLEGVGLYKLFYYASKDKSYQEVMITLNDGDRFLAQFEDGTLEYLSSEEDGIDHKKECTDEEIKYLMQILDSIMAYKIIKVRR